MKLNNVESGNQVHTPCNMPSWMGCYPGVGGGGGSRAVGHRTNSGQSCNVSGQICYLSGHK